jgi:hypothetical protein
LRSASAHLKTGQNFVQKQGPKARGSPTNLFIIDTLRVGRASKAVNLITCRQREIDTILLHLIP